MVSLPFHTFQNDMVIMVASRFSESLSPRCFKPSAGDIWVLQLIPRACTSTVWIILLGLGDWAAVSWIQRTFRLETTWPNHTMAVGSTNKLTGCSARKQRYRITKVRYTKPLISWNPKLSHAINPLKQEGFQCWEPCQAEWANYSLPALGGEQ